MNSLAVKILIFMLISAGLFAVSRKSLWAVRSHGFYRFFAWEFMLVLLLINYPSWFTDPFSAAQIVSWLLLLLSLALAGPGMYHILAKGKPDSRRVDDSLFPFERTTSLVTTGAYRYIRHPLYASLLFLAWGIFLKGVTWYAFGAVLAATLLLVATAKADEVECVRYFGPAYEEYMKRTKMFVPYLF